MKAAAPLLAATILLAGLLTPAIHASPPPYVYVGWKLLPRWVELNEVFLVGVLVENHLPRPVNVTFKAWSRWGEVVLVDPSLKDRYYGPLLAALSPPLDSYKVTLAPYESRFIRLAVVVRGSPSPFAYRRVEYGVDAYVDGRLAGSVRVEAEVTEALAYSAYLLLADPSTWRAALEEAAYTLIDLPRATVVGWFESAERWEAELSGVVDEPGLARALSYAAATVDLASFDALSGLKVYVETGSPQAGFMRTGLGQLVLLASWVYDPSLPAEFRARCLGRLLAFAVLAILSHKLVKHLESRFGPAAKALLARLGSLKARLTEVFGRTALADVVERMARADVVRAVEAGELGRLELLLDAWERALDLSRRGGVVVARDLLVDRSGRTWGPKYYVGLPNDAVGVLLGPEGRVELCSRGLVSVLCCDGEWRLIKLGRSGGRYAAVVSDLVREGLVDPERPVLVALKPPAGVNPVVEATVDLRVGGSPRAYLPLDYVEAYGLTEGVYKIWVKGFDKPVLHYYKPGLEGKLWFTPPPGVKPGKILIYEPVKVTFRDAYGYVKPELRRLLAYDAEEDVIKLLGRFKATMGSVREKIAPDTYGALYLDFTLDEGHTLRYYPQLDEWILIRTSDYRRAYAPELLDGWLKVTYETSKGLQAHYVALAEVREVSWFTWLSPFEAKRFMEYLRTSIGEDAYKSFKQIKVGIGELNEKRFKDLMSLRKLGIDQAKYELGRTGERICMEFLIADRGVVKFWPQRDLKRIIGFSKGERLPDFVVHGLKEVIEVEARVEGKTGATLTLLEAVSRAKEQVETFISRHPKLESEGEIFNIHGYSKNIVIIELLRTKDGEISRTFVLYWLRW